MRLNERSALKHFLTSILDRVELIRAAIAMLRQLERDEALTESCDPGSDEMWREAEAITGSRPVAWRNIILEYLDGMDRASIEGFSLALSAYIAIVAGGCVPDANGLRAEFRCREARDRAVTQTGAAAP